MWIPEVSEGRVRAARLARYQELLDTLREAAALARAGRLPSAYNRVLLGAQRGEAALEVGEPWAEDLCERYNLALEIYTTQLRRTPRCPLPRPRLSEPAPRQAACG